MKFVRFIVVSVLAGLVLSVAASPGVLAAVSAVRVSNNFMGSLPSDIPEMTLPQHSVILDAEGNVVGSFFDEDRVNMKLSEVSPLVQQAVLSAEDSRFYEHGAFDPVGLVRAASKGGSAGGGSGITQQYVKNLRMNAATTEEELSAAKENTLNRKLRELKIAAAVEERYTKDQILEGYLNIAYFGGGAYGVGSAARRYFGVSASEVTLPQAALLAGLVQNPSAYDPTQHPEAARKRRDWVLGRMAATNRITAQQAAEAKASPVETSGEVRPNGCGKSAYPHFCQMVRDVVASDSAFGATQELRDALLQRGGLTIRTTLVPGVQREVERAAAEAMGKGNEFATAIAVVEPGTGKVLGMGQSRSWSQTQVNLATSRFQNGSTFKPVTLAAALESGWGIDKVMVAEGRYCPTPKVCVNNAASYDAGPMNAVDAMAMSSNTFFTQLSVKTGIGRTQDMARRLGWALPDTLTGSEAVTTLGVYEVSPVAVANAYATFAAGGVHCNPTVITSVVLATGKSLSVPQSWCHQELSPGTAQAVNRALVAVVDGDNPHRTGKALSLGRPVIGKSGTTESSSAVWFAGGTPKASVAVWVGDPKGGLKNPVRGLRLYGKSVGAAAGATGAGPIWKDVVGAISSGDAVAFPSSGGDVFERVVPNFVGVRFEVAAASAREGGLVVEVSSEVSDAAPAGVVASQKVLGRRLVLVLGRGSAVVPLPLPVPSESPAPYRSESGGGIVSS